MIRKYRQWSEAELLRVRRYVETEKRPWSRFAIVDLARELGVTHEQARGAVERAIRAVRGER